MKMLRVPIVWCCSAFVPAEAADFGRPLRRAAFRHEEETEKDADVQHELEVAMKRIEHLDNSAAESEMAGKLEHIEAELFEESKPNATDAFSDEISATRATLCAEQGFAQHQSAECRSFMLQACDSESKLAGGGLNIFVSKFASAAACTRFFNETASEQNEDNPTAGAGDVARNASNGSAILGGKKMRKLPEQGFNEHGKPVVHKDHDTMTADWMNEHDSNAQRNAEDICAKFPDNTWCKIHGHIKKRKPQHFFARSAARKAGSSSLDVGGLVLASGYVALLALA